MSTDRNNNNNHNNTPTLQSSYYKETTRTELLSNTTTTTTNMSTNNNYQLTEESGSPTAIDALELATNVPTTNTRHEDNSSDYIQWLHAMKLVARLPGGVPAEFRRKVVDDTLQWINTRSF